MELLLILVPIALVDSLSITPLGLVSLMHILTGPRRYVTAAGFLSGLFLSYLVMALAFLFGLSAFLNKANAWLSHRWNNPEPADFGVEILLGLILLFFGLPLAKKRQKKGGEKSLAAEVTPGAAFNFGVMINVVGFPGAVPYFAAADQIARANVDRLGMGLAVVFYVGIFILPMVLMVGMHALLGARIDGFMAACKRFFDTTGPLIMRVAMVCLGLLMVADGVAYFLGAPLIPIGSPG